MGLLLAVKDSMKLKLPPEVLRALEGSICKWEDICMGHGNEEGYMNCPLCDLFYFDANCYLCPVSTRSGAICCENTPYQEWCERWERDSTPFIVSIPLDEIKDYYNNNEVNYDILAPMLAEIAEAELIYLLKLLPEGHPWREMI